MTKLYLTRTARTPPVNENHIYLSINGVGLNHKHIKNSCIRNDIVVRSRMQCIFQAILWLPVP